MYKVIANTLFTGYGYSLNFIKGVAYTKDKDLAEYLKKRGYMIEQEQKQTAKTSKK